MFLAKDVRNKTLRILADLTEAEAGFKAPGLTNSILWHAGHALTVVEHLAVVRLTGGNPSYPAGWFQSFSWKSNPAAVTSWPTLEQVRAQLNSQLNTLLPLIERATEEQLNAVYDPAKGATVRWSIVHGLQDEAGHQGEIWLLKKMARRR